MSTFLPQLWFPEFGWLSRPAGISQLWGKEFLVVPLEPKQLKAFFVVNRVNVPAKEGALPPSQVSATFPALQNGKSKYQEDPHRPAMKQLLTHWPGLKTANDEKLG